MAVLPSISPLLPSPPPGPPPPPPLPPPPRVRDLLNQESATATPDAGAHLNSSSLRDSRPRLRLLQHRRHADGVGHSLKDIRDESLGATGSLVGCVRRLLSSSLFRQRDDRAAPGAASNAVPDIDRLSHQSRYQYRKVHGLQSRRRMGELLAHGFHASPGKLHSRNWVTYIVSGGPGRERHSANIDRFISSDVCPLEFFQPFRSGFVARLTGCASVQSDGGSVSRAPFELSKLSSADRVSLAEVRGCSRASLLDIYDGRVDKEEGGNGGSRSEACEPSGWPYGVVKVPIEV